MILQLPWNGLKKKVSFQFILSFNFEKYLKWIIGYSVWQCLCKDETTWLLEYSWDNDNKFWEEYERTLESLFNALIGKWNAVKTNEQTSLQSFNDTKIVNLSII